MPLLVPSGSPEPLLVPSGSPEPLLVLSGSPEPLLGPSSSAPPERPRDSACPEYPLTFAPPECLPELVDFPFLGGSYPPLLTETPDPPWPMESPDPSWLPEAPDLPWPPKLPASVLETICALSASCVSVSSRSQSLPWVSSALPWWALVSSAPPWWALVSSAPHGPGPPSPPPIPTPLHRPPGLFYVWSVWKLFLGGALSRIRFMSSRPLTTFGAFPLHGTARYGTVRFTFGGFSTGYCTWYLILF